MELIREISDSFALDLRPCDVNEAGARLECEPGVYAWYFDKPPGIVPVRDCISVGIWKLLYVGIATKDMRGRILNQHFHGNASCSTLRLSLGCLLNETLAISLVRRGSSSRLIFGEQGEARLSKWMSEHARVAWRSDRREFRKKAFLKRLERFLVEERYSLPLNIDHNRKHPFCSKLKEIRKRCKRGARRG